MAISNKGFQLDSNSRVLTGDSLPNTQTPELAILPPSLNAADVYILGEVKLSHTKAEELHRIFMTQYLPYLPIIQSNSASELYLQSQLLFWTVCLTASLSEPTPELYMSLCSLIKQLAIETCWIQTPRSTHIVQALLILGTWPLPNLKVLDDCSYRFVTLAKSLAMQLGLHRGKFIYEFSRTQTSFPDAEKWRTRTWVSIFINEQIWSTNLGLPPNMNIDYLIEQSRNDTTLPYSFKCIASLAMFSSKVVNLLGSSVSSADGTLEPKYRVSTLGILEQELDRLASVELSIPLDSEIGVTAVSGINSGVGVSEVELYYLYIKLIICIFAFLPETPGDAQQVYVQKAITTSLRIVAIFEYLATLRSIIQYPVYIRHSVSLSAFALFRLHLYLESHSVDQSFSSKTYLISKCKRGVASVHRLFKLEMQRVAGVDNDISRTVKVLEKINALPRKVFAESSASTPTVISKMRSHLGASLFYEMLWIVHHAKPKTGATADKQSGKVIIEFFDSVKPESPQPFTGGVVIEEDQSPSLFDPFLDFVGRNDDLVGWLDNMDLQF